jgi:hypothetical protein
MRVRISQACIAWRNRDLAKLLYRLASLSCLALGLLALTVGCRGGRSSVAYTEVTGKVIFMGKGLPGGRLNFLAVNGGFAATGDIDQDGNYSIKAPVGEVQISVDNTMLQQGMEAPHPKRPGSEEASHLIGKYITIPTRYRDITRSGLKYTVKPGPAPQTHDIELDNTPDPAPAGMPAGVPPQ